MKKRGAKYQRRAAVCPTLVKLQFGDGIDFSVMTYTSINALIGGWAEHEHVEHLHDLANTTILVGHHKGDENAMAAGRAVRAVVRAAADRKKRVGRFGINGDELKTLRKFAAFVTEFYKRTSGEAITRAEQQVTATKRMAYQEAAR